MLKEEGGLFGSKVRTLVVRTALSFRALFLADVVIECAYGGSLVVA